MHVLFLTNRSLIIIMVASYVANEDGYNTIKACALNNIIITLNV